MKTMKELADHFCIPYCIVYSAMKGIKTYGKHNQKFDVNIAGERITACIEGQKKRAMEEAAYYDDLLRRVWSRRLK